MSEQADTNTEPTDMIHVLCNQCGMSATMVKTPTGDRAWADHMDGHQDPTDYKAWGWTVLPLF